MPPTIGSRSSSSSAIGRETRGVITPAAQHPDGRHRQRRTVTDSSDNSAGSVDPAAGGSAASEPTGDRTGTAAPDPTGTPAGAKVAPAGDEASAPGSTAAGASAGATSTITSTPASGHGGAGRHAAGGQLAAAGRRARHRSPGQKLVSWLGVIVVAIVVAVLVRTFVAESFYIPSGSMIPTLQIGDRILVNKLSFDFHPVERGDIVVFRRPSTWPVSYKDLVKRVIGLPGDTLWVHGGNVYVNGKALSQPWLPANIRHDTQPGPATSPYSLATPYTVPAGDYFVMGDNRPFSEDSRYLGPVPGKDIVGGVVFRYWPLSRLGNF